MYVWPQNGSNCPEPQNGCTVRELLVVVLACYFLRHYTLYSHVSAESNVRHINSMGEMRPQPWGIPYQEADSEFTS